MDPIGLYTGEPPTRKLRKAPEINALTLWPTFVISRSGVRIRPPAPTQLNMGEFQSGQMGQTVNLLAMPSVVRIHLIYCLLTPWTHVHVKALKTPLTQTATQMRIGAKSTGQFCPVLFSVLCSFLSDSCLCGHEPADLFRRIGLHISCGVAVGIQREARRVVPKHT